ncbi:MAG: hypothetical protein IIA17_11040 [candidate division Zixibacteria bacterium]|nr:hypothetical protein [candidate division Zixibacteria bacterium]
MKKIINVERTKKVLNLTREEFKKGDWLVEIDDDMDKVDMIYVNQHLIIRSFKDKRQITEKGDSNGRGNKEK